MVVRGILTPEGRELARLTRRAEADIAAVFDALSADVQAIFALYADRPLTTVDRVRLRRQLDQMIDRYFGATQSAAARSVLFLAIVRNTDRAAAAPMLRAVQDMEQLGVRQWGQSGWQDAYRRRRAVASIQTDPLSRIMVGADLNGPATIRQRALRAGRLDPDRVWVRNDGKTPYRLSQRVWGSGKHVRRDIDEMLRYGIRNGMSAVDLAEQLERYLTPHGAISRTKGPYPPPFDRPGSAAAQRLARTEISRVHSSATLEAAKATPGAQGVRWRLSAAHAGRDVCSDHAQRSSDGLPPGVYTTGEFPLMPSHPNCRCTSQIIMKSRDEVLDEISRTFGFDQPTRRAA